MSAYSKRRRGSTDDAWRRRVGMRGNRRTAGEVLVACLGSEARGIEWLGRLSEPDWDEVIRESVKQGIAPLFYRRVRDARLSVVIPSRATDRLREFTIGSAVRSLRLYHELAEILGGLGSERIPVIVLKGAYLAECVYGDKGLRPMTDVDLMVRRCDLSRAEAKLFEMGCTQRPQPYIEWDYSACAHLHPLITPGGTVVELHWTIESPTEPFAIDIDGLWRRARPATIAGVDVLVLSPEDLLLHLCLHTAFHHQLALGLRGCWDILETIRRCGQDIDWEQVRRRTREWGVEKYVHLMLGLARDLLGAPVPAPVLAGLEPDGLEPRMIALARAEILGQTAASVSARFAQIWGAGRIHEKASLLARTVFPSKKSLGRRYPACRNPRWLYLYYPVRWRDLLRKYGRSAWRMARRDHKVMTLVQREHERAVLMDWLKSVSL
jgi:hypothetical protein